MNEVVKVDGVRYKVLSAKTTKTVGDDQYGLGEKADGVFLILKIRASNDRKESSTLTDNVFSIEANGKKYEADTEGTTAVLFNGSTNDQSEDPFFLRDINPDTTTKGYVVFDIPTKLLSQEMRLRVNELGFGPNHGYVALAV